MALDAVLQDAGPRAGGEDDPLTTDTRFRLLSLTKMIATTAALQQVEKGELDLDAPVDTCCPRVADLQVLDGFDGATRRLFDVAVEESLTGPLGMDRTAWQREGEGLPDCTPAHVRGEDGSWTLTGDVLNQGPEWWAGGHGLCAPPTDDVRFERALLRGELDGVRILQEATVDAAFTDQIGDLDVPPLVPTADPGSSDDRRPGPGWKWGLGLLLTTDDRPGMRRVGSGVRAGLCNTQSWIDRTAGVCGSVHSTFLAFITPAALTVCEDVEKAVHAAR